MTRADNHHYSSCPRNPCSTVEKNQHHQDNAPRLPVDLIPMPEIMPKHNNLVLGLYLVEVLFIGRVMKAQLH
jgi:hypothetical protein